MAAFVTFKSGFNVEFHAGTNIKKILRNPND